VHRIGRTARIGRRGDALLYLLPREDTYVQFLQQKRVPIAEDNTSVNDAALAALPDVREEVKKMALADRAVMELGQRAFVAFVRAYREHKLQFIFVFGQVPFGDIARGLALLFLPKMPDLKSFQIKFKPADVAPSSITFKDRQREQQRLTNIPLKQAQREAEKKKREAKKKANLKKREAKKKANPNNRKRTHEQMADEWDELQKECRLMKKVSRRKMTKKEFAIAVNERKAGDGDGSGSE
jgi:ATP-dependent RNA helicase DDX55/SPB4